MTTAVQHPPLLTVSEVAERLRVSVKTVRRLVERGQVPALRVGTQIRIDRDEFDAWLYGVPPAVLLLRPEGLTERDGADSSPSLRASKR
jgi:excisionase family DNA binding protein